MTDGGALPAWFSRTLDALARPAGRHGDRRARRSAATWRRSPCTPDCSPPGTCSRADVAVVTQGPGNLGTGTHVGLLRRRGRRGGQRGRRAGRPAGRRRCASPTPTPRPRHRGVSHHSLTAYGRVALAAGRPGRCPAGLAPALAAAVARRWRRWRARHRIVAVATDGLDAALRASPGAAVHDGPRPRRRPRLLPGRRGGRPARRHRSAAPARQPRLTRAPVEPAASSASQLVDDAQPSRSAQRPTSSPGRRATLRSATAAARRAGCARGCTSARRSGLDGARPRSPAVVDPRSSARALPVAEACSSACSSAALGWLRDRSVTEPGPHAHMLAISRSTRSS